MTRFLMWESPLRKVCLFDCLDLTLESDSASARKLSLKALFTGADLVLVNLIFEKLTVRGLSLCFLALGNLVVGTDLVLTGWSE